MMASAMFLLVSFVGSLILLAVIYFNSQEESDATQQYLNVTLPNVIASLEDVANVSATYPVDIDDSNSLMFTLDNGTAIIVVINPNFDINGAKVKTNANIHPAEPIAYCFVKGLTQFANILEALENDKPLDAHKNGLCTSTNFIEVVDLSVSITFKANGSYDEVNAESIHTYSIDSDSIPGDTDEEKQQHAYKTLIGDITKEHNPELGDVEAFVDCENFNVYAEDTIIDLRGMKYATDAIIKAAISKHGYKKSTNI
jgi:hypothetical protein